MKRLLVSLAVTLPLFAAGVLAQNTDTGQDSPRERILRVIRLPRTADEARQAGVPDQQVREALSEVRNRGIGAGDAQIVLEEEVRCVKEDGPIDNFGAFVRSGLDRGLRGRDLASAIRAEHAARGKGKGAAKAGARGHGGGAKSKGKNGPGGGH